MSHARPLATLALALIGALAARTAGAQAVAESGFHAGQNALEADVTASAPGVAFLHFTSPTAALFVRVGADLVSARETFDEPGAPDQKRRYGGQADLSIGQRRYRPIAHAAAAFVELGLSAQYGHYTGTPLHYYGGGPYAEIGGQYSLAPNISVGVASGLAAYYQRVRYSDTRHESNFTVGIVSTRALVAFYY